MTLLRMVLHMGHIGQIFHAHERHNYCQVNSLTQQVNRDFVLIHQTFRIAVTRHYLRQYCIWVILVNIFMLARDIISAR